jgi:hypothetical protein
LIAALGIAIAGCNSSQTTAPNNGNGSNIALKSPDEQVDDLVRKYESLNAAEKAGETGKKLMADLMAIQGELSEIARAKAARAVSAHNLAQVGMAPHDLLPDGGNFPTLPPPGFDPKFIDPGKLNIDPKALRFPPRKTPDGKFPELPKLPDGKFPEFPKLPDLKFPDGPKLPDGKFPEFPKLPELKPPDGLKLPELKLPSDPPKTPDRKLPEVPKIPDEGDILPPPRENPRS